MIRNTIRDDVTPRDESRGVLEMVEAAGIEPSRQDPATCDGSILIRRIALKCGARMTANAASSRVELRGDAMGSVLEVVVALALTSSLLSISMVGGESPGVAPSAARGVAPSDAGRC